MKRTLFVSICLLLVSTIVAAQLHGHTPGVHSPMRMMADTTMHRPSQTMTANMGMAHQQAISQRSLASVNYRTADAWPQHTMMTPKTHRETTGIGPIVGHTGQFIGERVSSNAQQRAVPHISSHGYRSSQHRQY